MKINEISFDGQTGRIAALKFGDPMALPVIALHGWLDNAASFLPLGAHTALHWLALDMAGHGHSEHRPPGSAYHITDYVVDLCRVIDQVNPSACTLIAHSLGAGVAAMYAAAFPDRVDKLVLIDGIGPISGSDRDSLMQFRRAMSGLSQPVSDTPRVYPSLQSVVDKRMGAGRIERASAEILLQRGTSPHADGVVVHSDARLKQHSPIYLSEGRVRAILRGIGCPTLLIMADRGLVADNPATPGRVNAVKHIQTVTVPGYHHAHMDDAAVVAGPLCEFLQV